MSFGFGHTTPAPLRRFAREMRASSHQKCGKRAQNRAPIACVHSFPREHTPSRNFAEPNVDTATPKAYYDCVFTFIESPAFERVREVYLDDDEFGELQQFMMGNPEAGKIVRGSGGVRKLRWRRAGVGKRGGLRVIYFVRRQPDEFWMLALYTKTKQENAPASTLRQLKEAFENE